MLAEILTPSGVLRDRFAQNDRKRKMDAGQDSHPIGCTERYPEGVRHDRPLGSVLLVSYAP